MAKDKGNKTKTEEPEDDEEETTTGEDGDDDGPPPGFGLVTPERGRQNWWVLKAGAVLQGRLLGVFDRKGKGGNKDGQFIQVRVAKPTKAVIKGGEEVLVPVNGTINADVKAGLKDLANLAADGGVYDVWFKAVEKEDLKDGRTFWRFDVRKKVVKPPPVRAEAPKVDDSDIPF